MPGANDAASPTISARRPWLEAATAMAGIAAIASANVKVCRRIVQPLRTKSLIQLVSQLAPPSADIACSHRAELRVIRDQRTRVFTGRPSSMSSLWNVPTPSLKRPRSGAPNSVGERPSSHQLSHSPRVAIEGAHPDATVRTGGTLEQIVADIPRPAKHRPVHQECRRNSSQSLLPASRCLSLRWRTNQLPWRKSKSLRRSARSGKGVGAGAVRVKKFSQFTSQLAPPSALKACSQCGRRLFMSSHRKRIRIGLPLSVSRPLKIAAVACSKPPTHGRVDRRRVAPVEPPDRPSAACWIERADA